MPANLTPDYERAEQRYREALSEEDKLEALREMFRTIPKHKGTEKMQADLKRKISQMRKSVAKRPVKSADPYHIPRAGAGQVVLLGPPNVGKSAIVARCTSAAVKVADYPFTTAIPLPGMAHYKDVQIELVDTPPVVPEHIPGGMIGLLRNCDIIALVVDAAEALEHTEMLLTLLESRGIAPRTIARPDLDPSDLSVHCGVIVATRIDLAEAGAAETLAELYRGRLEVMGVSAETGAGLESLIERCWRLLGMIRVYTKQPGKPPDNDKPFALEMGSTVEDLAREIHRELPEKMKFARLWGTDRHAGQQVHRSETLRDGDVVEIHE